MSILGVIGSIAGGLIGASGSKKAADAQSEAADRAAQVQWDMYNQTRSDMGPWRDVGSNALYRYADLYGIPYGTPGGMVAAPAAAPAASTAPARQSSGSSFIDFMTGPDVDLGILSGSFKGVPGEASSARSSLGSSSQPATVPGRYSPGGADVSRNAMAGFFTSPDYQFRRDEGIKGVENSMLARGKGLSGAAGKALTRYSGDLASGEWNNYMNRIAALSGMGQTSATNLGQLGGNAASGIGGAYIAGGQAQGSGYTGAASGLNDMIGNLYYNQAYGGNPWSTWGDGGGGNSYTPATTNQFKVPVSSNNWANFIV